MNIRSGVGADLEAIVSLQCDRNGPDCDRFVRALFAAPDHGAGRFTVAEDGGRVVSSLCLIPERLYVEGIEIPTGQPEFVATRPEYEHRGLIRKQMDLVHQWSADAGDLTQIIGGIPYFYRQFGYEYAIPFPRLRLVDANASLDMPEGWSVRRAVADDLPAVLELERRTQAGVPLTAVRSEYWHRQHIENEIDTEAANFVAVRGGVVHGSAGIGNGPPPVGESVAGLIHIAADEPDAVFALLAGAAAEYPGRQVAFDERPGLAAAAYGISHRNDFHYSLYVRVPEVVALLDRLRPVLSARLERAGLEAASGRLLLSFYAYSVTIEYSRGEVGAIQRGPSIQNPVDQGGAGVPPDLVATLVYGRFGASGLRDRYPDVRYGRVAPLMDALFPAMESDLVLSL